MRIRIHIGERLSTSWELSLSKTAELLFPQSTLNGPISDAVISIRYARVRRVEVDLSRAFAIIFLPAVPRVPGRLCSAMPVVGDVHAQSGRRRSPTRLFPRGLRTEEAAAADLRLHARRVQIRRLRRRLAAAAALHASERPRVGGGCGYGAAFNRPSSFAFHVQKFCQ